MSLTWDDSDDVAEVLIERRPAVDPPSVRVVDLHHRACEPPGFGDEPKASSEGKLERIRMAWVERRNGRGRAPWHSYR